MKYLQWQLLKKRWLSNSNGFTIVEVGIVLALFTLIATLALVNFSWMDRVSVRAELDTLYATCHYLQQRARATNSPQELLFDVANNTYRYANASYCLPHRIQFGTIPGIKGPPASPNQVVAKPVTFVGNKIVFYPEGIIQAGAIYLKDVKNQVQYALSSGVAPVSYLRKYQYNGEWIPLT